MNKEQRTLWTAEEGNQMQDNAALTGENRNPLIGVQLTGQSLQQLSELLQAGEGHSASDILQMAARTLSECTGMEISHTPTTSDLRKMSNNTFENFMNGGITIEKATAGLNIIAVLAGWPFRWFIQPYGRNRARIWSMLVSS